MTILYLVRHGETEEMRTRGEVDSDRLTAQGKKQALALAKRFSKIHVDIIYASKQHRAHETAKFIQKKQLHTPFIVTPELKEIYRVIIGEKPKVGTPKDRLPKDTARNPIRILIAPTGLTILAFKKRKGKIKRYILRVNDTKHLSPNLAQGYDLPNLQLD